jgi:hypothetical protein
VQQTTRSDALSADYAEALGSQYGIGVHASSALASMAARIFLSCRAVTEKLDAELDRRAEHGGL